MIAGFLVYVVVHFALYALILRRHAAFGTERVVFLYHFVPAVVVAVMLASRCLVAWSAVDEAVLLVALQGIYSLSFLELWALADGGYSLRILEALDQTPTETAEPVLDELVELGAAKQTDRVSSLVRLGLVRSDSQGLGPTLRGRVAAALFRGMSRILHLKVAE